MPETKRPEMPTAHDQLIKFIMLCNAVRSKEGVLGKRTKTLEGDTIFNESIEVQDAEKRLRGVDSGLVQAIKFIYGRPNISHIDIPNLDLDKAEDADIIRELSGIIREDKINEAITLVEEAMADEEVRPGIATVATTGIEKAKKAMADFRPLQEAYLVRGKEAEKVQSIESLRAKRARLEASKEVRMEEVARYKKQIAEIDADIEEIAGKTKEKVADVIPFPAKPAEAEVIPMSDGKEQLATDIGSPEQSKKVAQDLKEEGAKIYQFPTKESAEELPDQPA